MEREAKKRTLVLPVERTLPTAPAERVRFGVALTAVPRRIKNSSERAVKVDRKGMGTHPKDEVPIRRNTHQKHESRRGVLSQHILRLFF